MSNTNSIFNTTPVRVPNKSGFNLDHEVLGTLPVGTLVPYLCDEIVPGTKVSLGMLANVELPPMATPFNGKVDLEAQAFFVPTRLLWQGWKSFISRQNQFDPDVAAPDKVPTISIPAPPTTQRPLYLTDALGIPNTANKEVSALSFLAYHRVYSDWYRDARIQKDCFKPAGQSSAHTVANAPWDMTGGSFGNSIVMADGISINQLRQRNYAKDYFTTAMLQQSLGDNLRVNVDLFKADGSPFSSGGNQGLYASTVAGSNEAHFNVGSTGSNNTAAGFTIAQLRTVNSLQMYMDTLGAAGNRYEDVMKAIWGVRPADEVLNKAVYLGQLKSGVYSKGVTQATASSESKNPYNGIQGAQAGQSTSTNGGSLIDNFEAREHGFIVVMLSLVPHAYYSTVTDRKHKHFSPSDFATGILAGAGNQEIWKWELVPSLNTSDNSVFGWTDRYAEYKFKHDRVFGQLQDGGYFDAFALKRGFDNSVTLSTSFIQIPKNALDDVLAFTDSSHPEYNEARVDCFFKYSAVLPLPAYSIPTLGLPNDTHTEMISRGGTRL